jgi:hypothetical protein
VWQVCNKGKVGGRQEKHKRATHDRILRKGDANSDILAFPYYDGFSKEEMDAVNHLNVRGLLPRFGSR